MKIAVYSKAPTAIKFSTFQHYLNSEGKVSESREAKSITIDGLNSVFRAGGNSVFAKTIVEKSEWEAIYEERKSFDQHIITGQVFVAKNDSEAVSIIHNTQRCVSDPLDKSSLAKAENQPSLM